MCKHQNNSGFTLFEVLIAILVLSIGLLGLAGTQLSGLRSNQGAYERSQALFLAYEMIDRMRANRPAALAGSYVVDLGSTPSSGTVAGNDVIDWKNNLASQLPSGDGSIALNGNIFTISVQWADKSDTAAPPFAFQFETQI